MKIWKKNPFVMIGISLFALTVHSAASAQTATQAEQIASASDQAIAGDIVVTAEKRSTSIQKVPVAVTALSGDTLAKSGINDIVTLAARVPNFNFGETFGAAKLSIRGISFSNLSTGAEGSVAYNLNDVYVARPAGQLGNFYDIDRVEVLRGPQGTLYGRNATGGAVNIYTARPTPTWTGFGQLTIGNYNDVIVEGGVGGPLSDTVGVRLAFFGRNRDGYGKNVITGTDVDDANVRGGRLTLSYKPAPNFSADVIADIGRERDHSNAVRVIAQRGLSGEPGVSGFPIYAVQLGARILTNQYDIAANLDTQYRRHTGGVAVNLKWDLGNLSIRSLSAWRRTHFELTTDIDGSSADFARIYYNELSNQYSQEFDLNYTGHTVDVTAGAFAFAENLNGFFWTPGTIRTAPRPGAPTGLPQPGLFIGNFAAGGKLRTRAYAVFGQASWHLTDQLTLVAGARYSTEQKFDGDLYTDFTQLLYRQPAVFDPLSPPLSGPFNQSKRWNSFTPKVGVNFQASAQTLLYASASKGFKAGVFNLGGTSVSFVTGARSNPPVNPETVWAYEGGIKTRILGQKLRLNLAGFYYDYKNLQLSKIVGTTAVLQNAAKARIYGLELETEYRPAADLLLRFNASWLHARFVDFINLDPSRASLGFLDLSGHQLPQAPNFTLNAGAEYGFDVPGGKVVPGFDIRYQTRNYFDEFNSKQVSQPAFAKVDLTLAYRLENGLSVTGFIQNLTNQKTVETAYTSTANYGFPVNGFLAPPRTFGARIRYSY